MRAVDRCWCDFSAASLFEPFNVSHWEYLSVQRLLHEIDRPKLLDDSLPQDNTDTKFHSKDLNSTIVGASTTTSKSRFWSRLTPFYSKAFRSGDPSPLEEKPANIQVSVNATKPMAIDSPTTAPLIRQEYDMRPYGLGIIIDFRWSG
jgi:hypothetical protein